MEKGTLLQVAPKTYQETPVRVAQMEACNEGFFIAVRSSGRTYAFRRGGKTVACSRLQFNRMVKIFALKGNMKIERAVLQLWEALLADESLPQPDWREVAPFNPRSEVS